MKKSLSTALAFGFILCSSLTIATAPALGLDVNASPIISTTTGGSVTKTGTTTNVNVNSGLGGTSVYDWKQFNVGKNQTVNFQFNNVHQTALNKVQNGGGMSQIYGKLTNSGVGKDTGKVILLNPNGILFGNGASVNLNSFTASSYDGKWNNTKQLLELTKNSNKGDIIVEQNASIHGAEGVNLVGQNVVTHKGSLISTNNTPSAWGTYGKVKLVTSDGVNFQYVYGTDAAGKRYSNGATSSISEVKNSTAKQMLITEGNISAGSVEMVNASNHTDSYLAVQNGSTIVATSAAKGENGSIVLTSNSNLSTSNAQLKTVNGNSAAAANTKYANYVNVTGKNVTLTNTKITTAGNNGAYSGRVAIKATNGNAVVSGSNINAANVTEIEASKIASIQNSSNVEGTTVTSIGGTGTQVSNSILTARNGFISLKTTGGSAVTSASVLKATNGNIGIISANGDSVVDNSTVRTNKDAIVSAGNIASVQNKSNLEGANLTVVGNKGSQVLNSTATARNGYISFRTANGNVTMLGSTLNATNGNIGVVSTKGNAVVDSSTVRTNKEVVVNAGNIASVQNKSSIEGSQVTVVGKNSVSVSGASALQSKTGYVNVVSTAGNAVVDNSTITSTGNAYVTANKVASVQNSSRITGNKVYVYGAQGSNKTSNSVITERN